MVRQSAVRSSQKNIWVAAGDGDLGRVTVSYRRIGSTFASAIELVHM